MAITLSSIKKGSPIRAPRMLVLGIEGIGKTSFSCGTHYENGSPVKTGINSPILIPCRGEEGADSIGVPMFPAVTTHEDMMQAIGALFDETHEYKTAVLDSASAYGPIVCDDVCAEFGVTTVRKVPGFRTGEASVLKRWREVLAGLDALRDAKGMASIIIGHVRIRKMKNPEGEDWDCYDFDLEHTDVSELLKRWADVVLFCNRKVTVRKDGEDTSFSKAKRTGKDLTGQRYLYTQGRPFHPGKGRGIYGMLPYELPLDWQAFEDAVAAAVSAGGPVLANEDDTDNLPR